MHDAEYWIKKLKLQKHPEGGYFRETYRASEMISAGALPARFGGNRCLATCIYFLLPGREVSNLHRLQADEIWHFYSGSRLGLHILAPDGGYCRLQLGPHPDKAEQFQAVIPAESWFCAELLPPKTYSLIGCTVSPGFEFKDFELGKREELIRLFPEHRDLVCRFTASEA